MVFNRYSLSWKTSIIDVGLAYKSFLSRFSMLINYTMCSSNLFFCIQLFPTFFIVQNFQSTDFSGSRIFRIQFFLSPGFSGSRFFMVRIQGVGPGSGTRFQKQPFENDLKIKLCRKRLYPTESVKYLGVKIDENLSWQYHVNDLSIKLNRANTLLSKMRMYVSVKILRYIYFAIFDSYISY